MNDNKLIAEFMGWDIESLSTIPSNLHPSNLELDNDEVLEYKFHTSWDWLMPVVQKCYESGAEGDCIGDITMYLTDVDIKSTYKAVVEFIKRYSNK